MNLLFELREAAKHCTAPLTAKLMRDAADDLAVSIKAFVDDPTRLHMQNLNGSWVRAQRVYDAASPMGGGDDQRGGAVRLNDEQRRAA